MADPDYTVGFEKFIEGDVRSLVLMTFFGPRVYPRGSYEMSVSPSVRPSLNISETALSPSLNISETALRIF